MPSYCMKSLSVAFIVLHVVSSSYSASYLARGISIGLSSLYSGWNYIKCSLYECCSGKWMISNFTELHSALKNKLHGQPLVKKIVVPSVMGHRKLENPRKALVLSFHGWTGGGKNFASKIIAESLYSKGMTSKYVNLFIARRDFPSNDKVEDYKRILQERIEHSIKQCEYSLFIFDEIDDMPPGLIDVLKPFIDYHEHINGVDYRKATYIFLSNTGGNEITKIVYDYWKLGKNRNEITMKDIEPLVRKGAFNENGGLKNSDIIAKHLIDAYVPFFPLERNHIKLCVRDDLLMKGRQYEEKIADSVADQMDYFPSDVQVFSTSGCKLVNQKVDLFLIKDFGFDDEL